MVSHRVASGLACSNTASTIDSLNSGSMAMLKMSLSSLITWHITSCLLTILPARISRTWLAIVEISQCMLQQDEVDLSELVVDQVLLLVAVWLVVLLDGCVAGDTALSATHRRVYTAFIIFRSLLGLSPG